VSRGRNKTQAITPVHRFYFAPVSLTIAVIAVLVCAVCLYLPALNGYFVFDDLSLPFSTGTRDAPFAAWISGVRPVLMVSYWLNYRLFGPQPFGYHLVNLAIHFANALLVFLVLFKLLSNAGWLPKKTAIASLSGALVFLIHPIQTESVSYVAGRSETLAALFVLLAYVAFLYRKHERISWREALLTLALFGAALATKENAISLAGVLILTDLFWPTAFSLAGLRRNWRLYALMAPGAILALAAVLRMLAKPGTAGFAVPDFKWYQYGFTEARAIFTYIRLAVLPFGQSLDHDYAPSHTIVEHGAVFFILLLAALVTISIFWRRRYPLACFGFLIFLTCLAPTSSIVPLTDPLVERRMYLALIGMILIGCEASSRLRVSLRTGAWVIALAALIFTKLCYDRNQLWGDPDRLLAAAAQGDLYNARPLVNYAHALIHEHRCDLAPAYLERAERRWPNNAYVNAAWGRALACLGQYEAAIQRLQTAARIQPSSEIYEWMGVTHTEMGLLDLAGEELKKALELNSKSQSAHRALGLWYEKVNDLRAAEQEYRAVLSLDPNDPIANGRLVLLFRREAANKGSQKPSL